MANRYYKTGVSGTWATANSWSANSAADTDNAGVPTIADDVFFTSGCAANTWVTVGAAASCRSLNCTGYIGTISHGAYTISVGDGSTGSGYPAGGVALILSSAGTYSAPAATSAFTFNSTSTGTLTVNYNGRTVGNQNFTGTAYYQLGGNFTTITAATAITQAAGTLDYNGYSQTGGLLTTTGTVARTLTFGSSAITLSQTGASALNYTGSNLTVTSNSGTITFTGASPTLTGISAGINWNGLNVVVGASSGGTFTIAGVNTFHNLTMNTGGVAQTIKFPSSVTTTFTGVFAIESTSNSNLVTLAPGTASTTATISQASGTSYVQHASMTYMAVTGGATFTAKWTTYGTGNSGWTFLFSPKYMIATGNWNTAATWSLSSGGSANAAIPLASDDVVLDANSGNKTLTINTSSLVCRSFDCTTFTGTITHNAYTLTIGDSFNTTSAALVLPTGGTYTLGNSTTSAITFAGSATGTYYVNYNGRTVGNQTFSSTGSYQLSNGFTTTAATLSHTNGTLDFGSTTVSGYIITSTGNNARTLNPNTANINVSYTGGTAFGYTGTLLTVTANSGTVTFTGASPTFAGGGANWNGLNIVKSAGAGTFAITGANTFNNLTLSTSVAQTITFPSSVTTTLTGVFNISSTSNTTTNLVTIGPGTATTVATISQASGTSSVQHAIMSYIAVTGGATFTCKWTTYNAGNSGWTFLFSPKYMIATGNYNTAATWSLSSGGSANAAFPMANDDVILDGNTGNKTLTVNIASACRSFDCTTFTGTISHGAFLLTVGDSFYTNSGAILVLPASGTYTAAGATSAITFAGTSTYGVYYVNYNGKTVGNQTYSATGSYQLLNNFTCYNAATAIGHTAGTLNFNGVSQIGGIFTTTGANTRTLTLGASTINVSQTAATAFGYTGSGLTITSNTATITSSGVSPTIALNGANWNGLSLKLYGGGGTALITGGGVLKDFYVIPSSTEIVTITTGTVVSGTGDIVFNGLDGDKKISLQSSSAGSSFTLYKSSGTVSLYGTSVKDVTASGGAVFNSYNSYDISGNTGFTDITSSVYYLDCISGSDTYGDPYGWWKLTYTNALGAAPSVSGTISGTVSGATAYVSFVNLNEWDIFKAGTLYLYGKNGTFQSGTISGSNGGTCSITGDATYCAWYSGSSGATSTRVSPGDEIRIAKTSAPVSLGNASWVSVSDVGATTTTASLVTFSGSFPVTLVDSCDSGWTGDGSTISHAAGGRLNNYLRVNTAAVTNTKLAHHATGALNLSSYNAITFCLDQNYNITDNQFRICLCSGTDGSGVVDDIPVPANPQYMWKCFCIQKADKSNFGSNINSIAIYSGSSAPTAGKYTLWDTFIATTASGLSLQSLISQSSSEVAAVSPWYAIRYIDTVNKQIFLDPFVSDDNYYRGHYGSSGTFLTYYRNTANYGSYISPFTMNTSGVSGKNINFQGGYSTLTNLQDGETHCSATYASLDYGGYAGVSASSKSYITINRLNFSRFYYGMYFTGCTNILIDNITNITGCVLGVYLYLTNSYMTFNWIGNMCLNYYGVAIGSDLNHHNLFKYIGNLNGNSLAGFHCWDLYGSQITEIMNDCNNGIGAMLCNTSCNNYFGKIGELSYNNIGLELQDTDTGHYYYVGPVSDITFGEITNIRHNTTYGISSEWFCDRNYINKVAISNNGTDIYTDGTTNLFLNNCSISGSVSVESNIGSANLNYGVYCNNYNNVAGSSYIYLWGGTINNQTSTKHSADGVSWELSVTDSRRDILNPLKLQIGQFAVSANGLVVFSAYVKKDHATNVGCQIICRKNQLPGITDDCVAEAEDNTDWQKLTITFTPSIFGVVKIEFWGYYVSGNSSVYVSDVTISQS